MMRVFNVWQNIFFISNEWIYKWKIERNNWVNNWTYTVLFDKDKKSYKEIMRSCDIFWNENEAKKQLIEKFEYSIERRENDIKNSKESIERYKNNIKDSDRYILNYLSDISEYKEKIKMLQKK